MTVVIKRILVSGLVASATSTAALALLAQKEGRGGGQPLNATSHWLHGKKAAGIKSLDVSHTAVGFATHTAATIFWAVFFEGWIAARRPKRGVPLIKDALLMSVVAAAVDYGATPKRFTPGWEFVLSKKSMAFAYAAMAVGLAAGALINDAADARGVRVRPPLAHLKISNKR
jgi:hypothetical protein